MSSGLIYDCYNHFNMNNLGTDSTTRMALNLRIVTIPDIPDMIITIMAGVILKVWPQIELPLDIPDNHHHYGWCHLESLTTNRMTI